MMTKDTTLDAIATLPKGSNLYWRLPKQPDNICLTDDLLSLRTRLLTAESEKDEAIGYLKRLRREHQSLCDRFDEMEDELLTAEAKVAEYEAKEQQQAEWDAISAEIDEDAPTGGENEQ